ncbi:hypothetical protein CAOG_010155 [Capsaspora owczarzaki ATCC 30864]|uniref:Uncharacterized protein n=1 Tax=Capsaspora owczarzaki (strain ATCC 30864) TaxID=595528 RepID=A0A0D2W0M0_CAPO3|nr:hypothetical protein CAOG_010155 [Capsaspora owczarzaki ATCC 30864]
MTSICTIFSELIVHFPLFGVGQHFVGVSELGKLVFGIRLLVFVWMVLERQFVKGLLDLSVCRSARYSEKLVVVLCIKARILVQVLVVGCLLLARAFRLVLR